jgi:hypothetical protein
MKSKKIVQIIPADDWHWVWMAREVEADGPPYTIAPLACWGLYDDGNVVGLDASEEGLEDVTLFSFHADHDFGFVEYIHAVVLEGDGFKEFDQRMKALLKKAQDKL